MKKTNDKKFQGKLLENFVYILLPVQILVLILSPRFGWNIQHMLHGDVATLKYEKTSYIDGAFHCIYQEGEEKVDISYGNLFSKKFHITVNETKEYDMEVKIDGRSIESETDMLPGVTNDIVWEDIYGIFYWRCILAVAMSLVSIKMFQRAKERDGTTNKVVCIVSFAIYLVSILISLRILF